MTERSSACDVPPPLELECLNALWNLGQGNVRQVREQLSAHRPLAYTTVMTLLDRLDKKGIVSRRKAGRSFQYQPEVSRLEMRRLAVRQLADRLFGGSVDTLGRFLEALNGDRSFAADEQPADSVVRAGQASSNSLDASLL